ncbi:MAG: sulfite exporter TauE/SafE family protein [Pseudomonadota bacterium]
MLFTLCRQKHHALQAGQPFPGAVGHHVSAGRKHRPNLKYNLDYAHTMLTDPTTLALLTATFFIAGLVKGIVGLGLPIVVLAMLATTLGLKTAMALFIVPGVAMNLWQATNGPAFRSLLGRFWPFWLAAIVGILIGTHFLARVDQAVATLAFGGLLAAYALSRLANYKVPLPARSEPFLKPVIGGSAGFIFGATGQFMVPGILYLEALGLKRDTFIQALGMTFLIITATLGTGLFANAIMTMEMAMISMLAIVPSFVGLWLGQSVRRYFSEELFRTILFAWLAITGVYICGRHFYFN